MPTYDYVCASCRHEFELFQPIRSAPKRTCPKCRRQTAKRQIGTGAGILFRGSGFYETDYRSEDYKKKAKAEQESLKKGSDAGDKGEKEKGSKEPAGKESGDKVKSDKGNSEAPLTPGTKKKRPKKDD